MSQATELAFAPEESAAILAHMNGDHGADAVLMCRALGGLPDAESARVTGVDRAGMDFEAVVSGAPVATRIAWGRTLTARAEVRGEVVRLYQESCAALGIEPRQAEQASH
jgi:putative heme iron utilization protein